MNCELYHEQNLRRINFCTRKNDAVDIHLDQDVRHVRISFDRKLLDKHVELNSTLTWKGLLSLLFKQRFNDLQSRLKICSSTLTVRFRSEGRDSRTMYFFTRLFPNTPTLPNTIRKLQSLLSYVYS